MNKPAINEVDAALKVHGNTEYMDSQRFDALLAGLSNDALGQLLNKFRSTRDFYKKILKEESRSKNPNSQRYSAAEKQINIYNTQGKILKQKFDNSKN